jgi:hypothetical protein
MPILLGLTKLPLYFFCFFDKNTQKSVSHLMYLKEKQRLV